MESQVQQDQFPDDVVEDVEGLLWLGYLEDSFEFCGHHFVIRTLRGDEEILAGLVTKEYVETLGQSKAWVWAQVGLALVSVDHDEDFCPPIGPNKRDFARARFQYATANWYWPLAQYVYERYAALLERQAACVEALQDLSNRSRTSFTASPGSLIAKADSPPPADRVMELLDEDEDSTSSNDDS